MRHGNRSTGPCQRPLAWRWLGGRRPTQTTGAERTRLERRVRVGARAAAASTSAGCAYWYCNTAPTALTYPILLSTELWEVVNRPKMTRTI